MYCSKCGTENPADAQVCQSCGAAFPAAPAPGAIVGAKTCGLATASLVLGLLTICGGALTAIPAIILGIVALGKVRRGEGRLRGTGLAVAGIATGGTVMVLHTVALLMAMVMLMAVPDDEVTFAEVIQPILHARTMAFDCVTGGEASGPVIHGVIVGNRVRQTISNVGLVLVLDLDDARMLTLDPTTKSATYVDMQGTAEEGAKYFMETVRTIVAKAQDGPDVQVQELGQHLIDGIKTVGFQVTQAEPALELYIWADSETATPNRIELRMDQSAIILENIEFDIPVDEALVSMEVPEGYSVHDQQMDLSGATEEDFVATLSIWVQMVLDGRFPDSMGTQELMQSATALTEAIEQQAASEDEAMQMGKSFSKGLLFLQQLNVQGEWHYAGKGVRLGDSDTAVFWYRSDKQAKTYRVIYGDLHVEEAGLDRLPQ